MRVRFLLFAATVSFVSFALSGCVGDEFPQLDSDTSGDDDDNNDDNNDDNDDDNDNDDNNDDDNNDEEEDDDEEEGDDDDDDAVTLDSGHDGWREPNCWASGCHDADSHNEGLDPYQCVECHGNNGTRSEHNAGENCSACHNNPSDHPKDSFPDNICSICHS